MKKKEVIVKRDWRKYYTEDKRSICKSAIFAFLMPDVVKITVSSRKMKDSIRCKIHYKKELKAWGIEIKDKIFTLKEYQHEFLGSPEKGSICYVKMEEIKDE